MSRVGVLSSPPLICFHTRGPTLLVFLSGISDRRCFGFLFSGNRKRLRDSSLERLMTGVGVWVVHHRHSLVSVLIRLSSGLNQTTSEVGTYLLWVFKDLREILLALSLTERLVSRAVSPVVPPRFTGTPVPVGSGLSFTISVGSESSYVSWSTEFSLRVVR